MIVPNGSTDVTTYFVLRDSTNHAPKTDVTITDIDLYYVEELTAISSKVDATALDAANSAHADNKAYHVGQGMYRVDWPEITGEATRSLLNAARTLLNKWTLTTGAGGYVVKKEDDSTTAWTGTPTVDGNGNVSGMDHD